MFWDRLVRTSSKVEINAPRVGCDKLFRDNTRRRWSVSTFKKRI